MEDAEIVELLLDRRRNAGQLLEIVGNAARTRRAARSRVGERRRVGSVSDDRLLGGADVDARLALRARNAVDRRLRDEIAVERDRAAGVVIARARDR